MKSEIRVPAVGESVSSGILAVWLKQAGDTVAEGEDLFELETEKATVAVPAPAAGVLEPLVAAGDEVTVDQQVAWIDADVSAATAAAAPPVAAPPRASAAARQLAAAEGVDLAAVAGSGKGGTVTKADVQRVVAERRAAAVKTAAAHAASAASARLTEPTRPPAAAAPVPPQPVESASAGSEKISEKTAVEAGLQTRIPMSPIRRKAAQRLVQARREAAHLTTFNEIDMTHVIRLRAQHREAFQAAHRVRLGFMSFFVKACCLALKEFPDVNATVDGEDIVYNHFYDIGVAISTERGLIVPVIRQADQLSFAEIETTIGALAQNAKAKRLSPDDLIGGTFSITNGGVFGSLLSTPIPAYPQTAILGMHAIDKRPVAIDEQIVIRPMMYVALTYDHRVIDGREAIGFLRRVKEMVEDPAKVLLEI